MKEYIQKHIPVVEHQVPAIHTFTGRDVLLLPLEQREAFAKEINQKLAAKPNTMLQWTAEELLESMNSGRSAVVTGVNDTRKLLGFAQVWEYQYDLFQYIHAGNEIIKKGNRPVLEAGSWLSFAQPGSGIGKRVFQEAIKAGSLHMPEALIIGIVEQNNVRANVVIQSMGGEKIGEKFSPVLKDQQGQPAKMYIYNMTDITERGRKEHAILQS